MICRRVGESWACYLKACGYLLKGFLILLRSYFKEIGEGALLEATLHRQPRIDRHDCALLDRRFLVEGENIEANLVHKIKAALLQLSEHGQRRVLMPHALEVLRLELF